MAEDKQAAFTASNYTAQLQHLTQPYPGPQQNNNAGGNGGVDDPIIALVVVPEFGLGGGLAALVTCFAAFTLFIRYKNNPKIA